MSGKFSWSHLSDININDPFFDTLRSDYPEFNEWFLKKSVEGREALVFRDNYGLGAFICLKKEKETIELRDKILPERSRLKISTMKIAERFRGQRIGEGALGVCLWFWRGAQVEEIYVTIYSKQELLISLFLKFGFECIGEKANGEMVYVKNRRRLSFIDPYKAFPYISSKFTRAGMIPIQEEYHDKLFPYSELMGQRKIQEVTAGNGVTKVFIAAPQSKVSYCINEPVYIYRIYNGNGKKYKSVITSFCTITHLDWVKSNGRYLLTFENFMKKVGNKTIFSPEELLTFYKEKYNLLIIEMVYNGYFGKGHNINFQSLKENGLFETYPYNIEYGKPEFEQILKMGGKNVQNIIIDSSPTCC